VLVDISGFTSLSEQLTAAGPEGTEQLIATLSRIFTVLLPATDDGGDVVKFAGDALLILFTGEDHARHAVHAAWNMNRVLAAVGDVHLPAARARLRMSVGVHSGTFPLLLTGDASLNTVMTGRDVSRVLELQSAAPAGRILVSDETAAHLPAKQVRPEDDVPGAHRLLRAGSVPAKSLMALTTGRGTASERFLPRAFAERPDLLSAAPDHRWAAIAFVQVGGVPDEPTEEDLQHVDALTDAVEVAAAETGSTLLDVDVAVGGFRYFLTAGAPTAVEDPEGRLVTAVLRIVGTDSPYSLRAGVTSGRIFAGFVGAPYRQTYTVMGDSTNLAARLTARAQPGTVLAARSVLERTATPFTWEDGGTITVKGKKQEIPVAVVTATGTGATTARETPFVGREAEQGRILALLDAAAAGRGGRLTVVGPPGIGKSRLLAEALADSHLPVLRADGDRYAANTPYRTAQTLLRPLLGIPAEAGAAEAGTLLAEAVCRVRADLEPWVPLLAPAVGGEVPTTSQVAALDEDFRVEKQAVVLRELMEALAPASGCVVIDDAQWVDPTSAALLTAVLDGDDHHAVLLCRRESETGGLALEGDVLVLGPLSDQAAEDLVEGVVGRQLLPADLAPILSRGAGSPLYLIELAGALASQQEALGIEQLVGERIDALSEKDRTTLRHAAVLGTRIPLPLYLNLVGPPLITGELASFLQLTGDAVTFRSELFRDVAYEQLTYQKRRELHRAAATAIAANPTLAGGAADAMLMVHHLAAGNYDAARVTATRSARAAEHALALDHAVRAFRTAVDAARQAPEGRAELPTLLADLGRVCVATGRCEDGLTAYTEARKLTPDPVARAMLDRERGYALNVLGRPDEALRVLRAARRAARAAGEDGRHVLAALAVTEAGIRLRQARWADARTLAAEAAELLEGRPGADPRVLADAYRYQDIAASELEGDAAMTHLQQALELYDAAGDELSKSKVLSLLGVRSYYRGDWVSAAALYGQAREAAEAAGDVVGAAIEAANAAEVLIDQGRVEEAAPLVRTALRVFTASGSPYLVAFITGFRGRGELRSGDFHTARERFTEAAEQFGALDEVDAQADVLVRRIEADLELADLDSARAEVAALTDRELPGPPASQLLRHRSRLAELDGDLAAARELARQAADVRGATPFDRALALVRLAQLGEADATALREEAESILRGLGVVDVEALLGEGLARSTSTVPFSV